MPKNTPPASAPSQAAQLLAILRRSRCWVALPLLVRATGAYRLGARIHDLRLAGWNIQTKIKRLGRRVHSFYRLGSPTMTGH